MIIPPISFFPLFNSLLPFFSSLLFFSSFPLFFFSVAVTIFYFWSSCLLFHHRLTAGNCSKDLSSHLSFISNLVYFNIVIHIVLHFSCYSFLPSYSLYYLFLLSLFLLKTKVEPAVFVVGGYVYDLGPESCATLSLEIALADLLLVWGTAGTYLHNVLLLISFFPYSDI